MPKSAQSVGPILGVCKPTSKLVRQATILHGPKFVACVGQMVEDTVAVNAFAALLDKAMTACTTKDGRLDLRDMAMFVIKEMRRNQL